MTLARLITQCLLFLMALIVEEMALVFVSAMTLSGYHR